MQETAFIGTPRPTFNSARLRTGALNDSLRHKPAPAQPQAQPDAVAANKPEDTGSPSLYCTPEQSKL